MRHLVGEVVHLAVRHWRAPWWVKLALGVGIVVVMVVR